MGTILSLPFTKLLTSVLPGNSRVRQGAGESQFKDVLSVGLATRTGTRSSSLQEPVRPKKPKGETFPIGSIGPNPRINSGIPGCTRGIAERPPVTSHMEPSRSPEQDQVTSTCQEPGTDRASCGPHRTGCRSSGWRKRPRGECGGGCGMSATSPSPKCVWGQKPLHHHGSDLPQRGPIQTPYFLPPKGSSSPGRLLFTTPASAWSPRVPSKLTLCRFSLLLCNPGLACRTSNKAWGRSAR